MTLSVKQIERVKALKTSMAIDSMLGNFKKFRNAKKEYASIAIQDFQTIKNIPSPQVTVPLFSKTGLNMLYVAIRNFFSIKTPEEKLLKQMSAEEKARQKLNQMA